MHLSSCSLPFPPSELRRILTPTLMSLYDRIVQQKEVAEAGLEGLEECPWCEWKCVMEVGREQDGLFRCGNEEGGCGVVSCRFCWKKDHSPKSCKEVEEDKRLDGRHRIEEAMSAFSLWRPPFFSPCFGTDWRFLFVVSGCDDAELSKVQERFVHLPVNYQTLTLTLIYLSSFYQRPRGTFSFIVVIYLSRRFSSMSIAFESVTK
jgi:hypothetical protein